MKPSLALATAWLAAAGAFDAALAASLQITVTGADGRPAADTVVLLTLPAGATPPALPTAPVVVEQREIRFVPYVAVVRQGATVRFVNRDDYDHHIRSLPGGPLGNVAPAKVVELRLAPARRAGDTSEDIRLDLPGTILLGCHLHGSMRGHVFVAGTPWFAVTDDRGQALIEGLPTGNAEMHLWHPDQLVEQPVQRVEFSGAASVVAKLNITPRRRPPPRRIQYNSGDYGPPGAPGN